MFNRQIRIEPARTMDLGQQDNARSVIRTDRHEDVIHRVQRLQVKNGQLEIMSGGMVPALLSTK
ncbi:MAG: hypothetical protein ABI439_13045 [Rhodospirillales bacterium]